MAEQDQDRSEKATPFKLQEARKRGQVAKSLELSSWLILMVVAGVAFVSWKKLLAGQLAISAELLGRAGAVPLSVDSFMHLFASTTLQLFSIFAVFILALLVVGAVANIFQTGPIFSVFPLKPNFDKLNPVNGFKRLFSFRTVYETVKNIIKLLLVCGATYLLVKASLPSLMALLDVDVQAYPSLLVDLLLTLVFTLLGVMFLIVAVDLIFVRWEFGNNMMMSRREVKDEVKRRDGDPKVKAKIKELQRQAAKRAGTVQRTPDADVVITNPTHLSVALKYDRERMAAPVVYAKGAGEVAMLMRKAAREANVPLVENKRLARRLYRQAGIDQPIPADLFAVVARILLWSYRQRSMTGQ